MAWWVEVLRTIPPAGSGLFLRAGIVDRLIVAQSLCLLVVAGHYATTAGLTRPEPLYGSVDDGSVGE